jgi:hypothetical protein
VTHGDSCDSRQCCAALDVAGSGISDDT